MSGIVRHAKIESRTSRAKLRRGRGAHWHAIIVGRVHLGYQRKPGDEVGRWIVRRYLGAGRYRITPIGLADDRSEADGERVLSFEQAKAHAIALAEAPRGRVHRLTVRGAFEAYVAFKRSQGQPVGDLLSRGNAHILGSSLADKVAAELTSEELRRWLATLAASPAMVRSKQGSKQNYRPGADDDETIASDGLSCRDGCTRTGCFRVHHRTGGETVGSLLRTTPKSWLVVPRDHWSLTSLALHRLRWRAER